MVSGLAYNLFRVCSEQVVSFLMCVQSSAELVWDADADLLFGAVGKCAFLCLAFQLQALSYTSPGRHSPHAWDSFKILLCLQQQPVCGCLLCLLSGQTESLIKPLQ